MDSVSQSRRSSCYHSIIVQSTTVTSEAIHKQSSVPETQHAAFTHRRGNIKFSSAKYSAVARTRKTGGLLSFRSTRRTAPRPTRVKGIFENVLNGFKLA